MKVDLYSFIFFVQEFGSFLDCGLFGVLDKYNNSLLPVGRDYFQLQLKAVIQDYKSLRKNKSIDAIFDARKFDFSLSNFIITKPLVTSFFSAYASNVCAPEILLFVLGSEFFILKIGKI